MKETRATTTTLGKQLGISRSALYYKPKKPPRDEEEKAKILSVMQEHPAYGHRRVAMALRCNHKKAHRLMKKFGLKPKIRRGYRLVKPDDVNRPETRIENILTALCPIRPTVVWAGDFTYLLFQNRFWYVATVIDVYTREILGWHIANHHTTSLIMQAWQDALCRTGRAPKWFHSDQGSEYVSGAYAMVLQQHGTTPSNSRKSSPWQNGVQESFYNNFKLELGDIKRCERVGELIEAVHMQICYYNNQRIHTMLKMPPIAYRQMQQQKKTAVPALLQPIY